MDNLRKLRKARGMSMRELGEAVGVSESMIGMIETGRRKPSYELLLKLGEELDCGVDYLVNDRKIPITESDGQNLLDLSQLNEEQKKLIEDVLRLNPQQRSAVLSVTESFLSNK